MAAPGEISGAGNWAILVLIVAGFVFFGLRFVWIMRDPPQDVGEFLRRWFGK